MAIETFYEVAITESASLRPDLQYIQHPGGTDAALALGLRLSVQF